MDSIEFVMILLHILVYNYVVVALVSHRRCALCWNIHCGIIIKTINVNVVHVEPSLSIITVVSVHYMTVI